ncbi:hypothetical protein [Thiothrix lacustris]|uniref:hypothetical protein n=1 Tax=Thiothrix lacustris TaxID=525917 RepID=UPI0027E44046|nr:hypothetical protein [Thiothrix lacustris]WMP19431.1 hypothetical protein RCS87_19265 [Thiothrix lacustris]
MRKSCLAQGLTSLLPFVSVAFAEPYPSLDLKPTGVSLEWYQHELDLKVTGLDVSLPGVSSGLVDSVKDQLDTQSDAEIINLRLDRQLSPNLNIFAAIGKVTDTTRVGFSSLAQGVSDLVVANKGVAYSAGATLTGEYGKLLPALHYTHSRIDFDDSAEEVVVNVLTPSVGIQTHAGVLSGSLVYQAVEATYSGTIDAPFVGNVPVSVNTKNKDTLQVLAGIDTRLANDLYLSAKAGLNGQKQFQLQLNRRF